MKKNIRIAISLYALVAIIVGACLNVGIKVPFVGKILYMPVHVTACMAADMLQNAEPEIALAAEMPTEPVGPVSLNIEAGIHQGLDHFNGRPMEYRLYIPEGAVEDMPLVVWLHGSGTVNHPEKLDDAGVIRAAIENGEQRFIILQPCTSTNNWTDRFKQVSALIDEIIAEYHCDPQRIILTGYSLGAMGAWDWANKAPEKWAAVIPVAERSITSTSALVHSNIPIWAIWANGDEAEVRQSMKWLAKKCDEAGTHKDVRTSQVQGDHSKKTAWQVYTPEVFDWMAEQHN